VRPTKRPVGTGLASECHNVIWQEQLDVRTVCVQFQPDRATADESRVRQAFRTALPDAEIVVGEDDGRYENIMFDVPSPEVAFSRIKTVFDSPTVGRAARASCIVTCQGERGWDDYLLLHHFDPAEKVDVPVARPAE